MELIEKVKNCLVIVENNDHSHSIPESLVEYHYKNDSDFSVILEKIRKFNELMVGLVGDSFEKFVTDNDFDTDIWPSL